MAQLMLLVVALLAPAFGLPLTAPKYIPEIQIEQETSATDCLSVQQSGVEEKTGVPVSTGCSSGFPVPATQENFAPQVNRVQDSPVTLFSPPQSVIPGDQIVRPVIVPAEAIASGRVIIMAVEPVQQRAFPDVIIVPEQRPIVSESPVQQVQAVEKNRPQQESYVQPNGNAEPQNAQPNFNEVPQKQSQVQPESYQNYPEQVYVEKQANQVQNAQVQPVLGQIVQQGEYFEKQGQSGVDYIPQTAEPVQQERNIQETVEKAPQENVQQAAQLVPENVQKQVECATQAQPQRVNVKETGEQVQPFAAQLEQAAVQQEVQQPEATRTETQQAYSVPQQVSNYESDQVYNFGDKIPQKQQQQPVEPAAQQQQYLARPVVVEN